MNILYCAEFEEHKGFFGSIFQKSFTTVAMNKLVLRLSLYILKKYLTTTPRERVWVEQKLSWFVRAQTATMTPSPST